MFVIVFREYLHNLPREFSHSVWKVVATVPLFSETSNKKFSNVLCEKLSFLWNYILS